MKAVFAFALGLVLRGGGASEHHVMQAAREAEQAGMRGDHADAVLRYGRLVDGAESLPPDYAAAVWFNYASSLEQLDDLPAAAKALGNALKAVGAKSKRAASVAARAEVFEKRGDVYAKLGLFKKALGDYRKQFAMDPISDSAAANAGACLLHLRQEAVAPLEAAVKLSPKNSRHRAHLALAYVRAGDLTKAHAQVDALSGDGAGLFFSALLVDSQGGGDAVPLAIAALELALLAGILATTQGSSAAYRLGRLYDRAGRGDEAAVLRRRAVLEGVWVEAWQRPGYFVPALRKLADAGELAPMPWFVKRDASSLADGASDGPSPAGGASCRDDGTCEASVQGSVLATLEDLATALQRDVFEDAAKEWRAFVSNDSKKLLRDDDENIADRGKWEQLNFARNGVWVPEESDLGDLRPYFVETQRRLREMLATAADRLPKGSVEISVLWPGSHLAAHSGPSNHRLRLHLVLAGGGPGCKLRVGDSANAQNAVEYHAGQVLAFDDAFDHEVWNDSQEARAVLLFDVWHPALNENDRESVRQHFGYDATASWRTNHKPGGGPLAA